MMKSEELVSAAVTVWFAWILLNLIIGIFQIFVGMILAIAAAGLWAISFPFDWAFRATNSLLIAPLKRGLAR